MSDSLINPGAMQAFNQDPEQVEEELVQRSMPMMADQALESNFKPIPVAGDPKPKKGKRVLGLALAGLGDAFKAAGGQQSDFVGNFLELERQKNALFEDEQARQNLVNVVAKKMGINAAELKDLDAKTLNKTYSHLLNGDVQKASSLAAAERDKLNQQRKRDAADLKFERDKEIAQIKADNTLDQINIRAQRSLEKEQAKQATKTKKDEKITPQMRTIAGFSVRTQDSNEVLNDLEEFGSSLKNIDLTNELNSSNKQKLDNAANDFIAAVLRKESGAAIGKEEMRDGIKRYIPVRGDSKEVLKQKRANRVNAMATLSAEAGDTAIQQIRDEKTKLLGEPTAEFSLVRAPNGKVLRIPSDKVEAAIKAGGELVQ